jgi:2,3-bisphosphoglycerate-dependent phosphoglycerate mutase
VPTLILLRHGESTWNRDERFAGWADVDLTSAGVAQAREAGWLLREAGIVPDVAYTSLLRRAIRTLELALEAMDRASIPIHRDWRLNERHYGALEGEGKREAARRLGEAGVQQVRRGLRMRPPALLRDDPRHPIHSDAYREVAPDSLPAAESLQDTLHRVLPYWEATIAPSLTAGRTPLVCAHTHTLRALLYHLDLHTEESIETVEIPPATPMVYRFDTQLRPIDRETLLRERDAP